MAKQKKPAPPRIDTLYERAQGDPQFFHDLIWNTEKLLPSLDFLTRQEKAALLATEPAELLRQLTTARVPVTVGAACDNTCIFTCGVGTCTMSCAGAATRLQVIPEEEARYFPEFLAAFQQVFNRFRR